MQFAIYWPAFAFAGPLELPMTYAFSRLQATGRDFRAVYDRFAADDFAGLAPARPWGAFHGLFGVGSNELIVVTYGDVAQVDAAIAAQDEVAAVDTLLLEPTVRPTSEEPRSREGLYVFRFFDVAHKDVDEIASLSFEAWKDFETGADYSAIPQALFRQHDISAPRGRMLLCTWYDGLNSWQASRTPPGEAGARFRRRHALTQGTIAYATRLVV